MQIFTVISLARQLDGEYVFVMASKAFKKASLADAHLMQKKADYTAPDGKPRLQSIDTPMGKVQCVCEVGVFAVELEEGE